MKNVLSGGNSCGTKLKMVDRPPTPPVSNQNILPLQQITSAHSVAKPPLHPLTHGRGKKQCDIHDLKKNVILHVNYSDHVINGGTIITNFVVYVDRMCKNVFMRLKQKKH